MSCRAHVAIVVVATVLTSLAAASSETGWFGSEFSVVQRVYEDCQNKNDIVGCLKGKALSAINKAVEQVRNGGRAEWVRERDLHPPRSQESLPVLDGVAFVKQNATNEDAPSIVEGRFLNGLAGVDKALVNSLDRFFKTHMLKLDMNSEARGKISDKFHDKIDEIKEKRGNSNATPAPSTLMSLTRLSIPLCVPLQARRSSEVVAAAAVAETREARSTAVTLWLLC